MAFEEDVMDVSLIAGADLFSSTVNYQYHFVKLSADNTVVVTAHADNDTPIGVLQNKPSSGQIARVRVMGVSRMVVSADGAGAVAYGDKIGTDATGHAVAKTLDTEKFLGVALDSASAGELATVLITGAVKTISN